jgi:hypothetical protein
MLRDDLLSAIEYIKQVKNERKMIPDYALKVQIKRVMMQRIDAELDLLVKEKILKTGDTCNDVYYEKI